MTHARQGLLTQGEPVREVRPASGGEPDSLRAVHHIMATLLLMWLADSVTLGTLWDTYLYDLGGAKAFPLQGNAVIGVVETTRGLVAMAAAIPMGHLSDRFGRVPVLRAAAALLGVPGLALIGTGLMICDKSEDSIAGYCFELPFSGVYMLVLGVVAYAVFFQTCTATIDAFVADVLPPGKARTRAYAVSRMMQAVGRATGPLSQAFLLWRLGNEWSPSLVRKVLLSGNILYFLAIVGIFRLQEKPRQCEVAGEMNISLQPQREQAVKESREECVESGGETVASVAAFPTVNMPAEDSEDSRISWVPLILQLFNIIFMLGSGMMLKYCPLFFKKDYNQDPVNVCLIMAAYWLASAAGTQSANPLLRSGIGRAPLSLTMHVLGTVGLFAFAFVQPLSYSVAFFMIRAVVTNACLPINTSLMMDNVSKKNRGKWAALNSLNRATWSGSSLIGGLIADAHGYRTSFAVTAVIFSVAGVAYSPLLCLESKP